jgi:adenine-specific DNA-methyltransferase
MGGGANLLIQGDNLEALKALLPFYAGQVKCIFIDPPYNTGSAFEHYDDNLEHSTWLSLMYPRLELLRELLSEDGSIWVTIDDNEAHYLKVAMDEVFGRKNFVANVIWEKSDSPKMDSQYFSSRHDHVVVFAKQMERLMLRRIKAEPQEHYNRTDESGRRYYTKPLRAMGSGEDTRAARPSMYFSLTAPDGSEVFPKKPDGSDGRWRWGLEKVQEEQSRLEWVKGKNGWAAYYRIYEESSAGRPPETIWNHPEVGSNRTSKAEVKNIFGSETTFTTPKPERLIERVLDIATFSGDLVLDSFLGSGTTAAVAHKMGRRYIGIEMGEHAVTHCAPRLRKVIEGEQGGISESVGWRGGGGFRFLRLGEPLFDPMGLINPAVRFRQLATFVWFSETHTPMVQGDGPDSPLLGVHESVAIYLLYNGILGDKRPDCGNVLTSKVLESLPRHVGPKVIFGEATRLGAERLRAQGITFKQTPFDLKAR